MITVEDGELIIADEGDLRLRSFAQEHLRMGWDSRKRRWHKRLTPALAVLACEEAEELLPPEIPHYKWRHAISWMGHPKTESLWKHQQKALHLVSQLPGVLLAMEMGTGKTRVVVEYAKAHPEQRILVLCPKSVVAVWAGELEKWGYPGNKWALRAGSVTKRAAALNDNSQNGVVITNYESAWRKPLDRTLEHWKPDVLVLDESHRVKSPGSNIFKWLRLLARHRPDMKRVLLTGTPMPHGPLDIWAQMHIADPGLLDPTYTQFERRYAIKGGWENRQVVQYRDLDELSQRCGLSTYQVNVDDVLDMPETIHQTIPVTLPPKVMKVYKELEDEFIAESDAGLLTVANAGVAVLRLQQLTGGMVVPAGDDGRSPLRIDTSKRDVLADLLVDLDKSPVAVFCRFRADLHAVREAAGEGNSSELSGSENTLAQWQAGETQVLAVQIQSGGLGVDLSRARVAVFYSTGWSLGEYLQACARLRRPNQQARTIELIHLVAEGTVDETIVKALTKKQDVVSEVMQSWK